MSKPNMGKILNPEKEYTRDATHVPIIPVIADQPLCPGQKIRLYKGVNGQFFAKDAYPENTFMGVVDPFINGNIKEGDKFYCWIKPNTVKELWHEWKHSFFD